MSFLLGGYTILFSALLKCRNTDIYIKPECICSFYNVFEATLYHGYSSCPAGAESDIVTQLKCKKYRDT